MEKTVGFYIKAFSLIVMVVFLVFIYFRSISSYEAPTVDTDKLFELLSDYQCDDGGFADLYYPRKIGYMDLYDTYYSLCALRYSSYQLSDAQLNNLHQFLDKISTEFLVADGIYDNLEQIYFYLSIAKIVDYKIPKNQFVILNKYIKELQMEQGYFARSKREKDELQNNLLNFDTIDSISLSSVTKVVELCAIYDITIDVDLLKKYFSDCINTVDFSVYNQLHMAFLSLYTTANSLFNNALPIDIAAKISEYITLYEPNTSNDIVGILCLVNLHMSVDNESFSWVNEELDRFSVDGGFSTFAGSDWHVLGTMMALQIINKLGIEIDKELKNDINFSILSNEFYGGGFVVEKGISNIYDTLNIVKILKDADRLELYKESVTKYAEALLNDDTVNSSLVDDYSRFELCRELNISIPQVRVDEYFSNAFNYLFIDEIDYLPARYELATLVVQSMKQYNYELNDMQKQTLLSAIDNDYELPYMFKLYNINLSIAVYDILDNKAMLETQYMYLTEFFNSSFKLFEDKIYAAILYIKYVSQYGNGIPVIEHKNELLKEIRLNSIDFLYKYSTYTEATVRSTYDVFCIIEHLSTMAEED